MPHHIHICPQSTLLSLIAGLYDADAGSVRVGGATVHSKVRSADRKVWLYPNVE